MIANRTIEELTDIAASGGCIEVSGNAYTAEQLVAVALALVPAATLRIRNSSHYQVKDCKMLASAMPGHVIFS